LIGVRVGGLMRLYIGILLALMATHAASATNLSPDQIQTVLKNSGFANPGRLPIWHVEQEGDGKAVEPGGIAWWVTVYYAPKALAVDLCVIEGSLIQVNDRLLPLNTKARRKIALRSCNGIDPSEFQPLSGFDDREMVSAVRIVQSLAQTGSVPNWSIEFSDAETRDLVRNLDQRRLYSISDLFDDAWNVEIYLAFRTDVRGRLLAFTVNEVAHTVRVHVDEYEITDAQGT